MSTVRTIGETIKNLELDLYEGHKDLNNDIKPDRKLIFGGVKNPAKYATKPSTHGGFYFAGVGCILGGVGGLLWNIGRSLYSESPEILTKIYQGSWTEVGYQALYLVGKSALNAAYIAGASGTIGYIGGSVITSKIWDSIKSFFSFKKRKR